MPRAKTARPESFLPRIAENCSPPTQDHSGLPTQIPIALSPPKPAQPIHNCSPPIRIADFLSKIAIPHAKLPVFHRVAHSAPHQNELLVSLSENDSPIAGPDLSFPHVPMFALQCPPPSNIPPSPTPPICAAFTQNGPHSPKKIRIF